MNGSYCIVADSNSEMSAAWREELPIVVLDMPYMLDDAERTYDFKEGEDIHHFYQRMREGAIPTTMQRNAEEIKDLWIPILEDQTDVLHLSFSSALSGTYDNACMAQKELAQAYPERKIIVIDTKSIAPLLALMIRQCVQKQQGGLSMEEVAKWVEENKQYFCGYIVVDDLVYLQRGGRLKSSQAIIGNMLNLKPLVYLDSDGGLLNFEKVRGHKKALRHLVALVKAKIDVSIDDTIIVAHGDAKEEAERVVEMLKEAIPDANVLESVYMGPVIGSHVGPGIIAICFAGYNRENPSL